MSEPNIVVEFKRLLEHMEWADAFVWKTVLKLRDAQQDATLLHRLHHLASVQWVYLQVWRGEPLRVPEPGTLPDLATMSVWAWTYYTELPLFLEGLEHDAVSRPVDFPWANEIAQRLGPAAPATLGESIQQVVLHSTYHRGQIATRIRELGAEPPLTDFIAWVWKGRPAPQW